MKPVEYPIIGWNTLVDTLKHNPDAIPTGSNFFTRGGSLVAWIIRVATRLRGEAETFANHVGKFYGLAEKAGDVLIVEAQTRVNKHGFVEEYRGYKGDIIVLEMTRVENGFRLHGLDPGEQACVRSEMDHYIGTKYGYVKLLLHAIDRWVFGGGYVARRLARMDNYPICSWVVAWVDWHCLDYAYAVPPRYADPDHILDDQVRAGARVLFANTKEALTRFNQIYEKEFAKYRTVGAHINSVNGTKAAFQTARMKC